MGGLWIPIVVVGYLLAGTFVLGLLSAFDDEDRITGGIIGYIIFLWPTVLAIGLGLAIGKVSRRITGSQ